MPMLRETSSGADLDAMGDAHEAAIAPGRVMAKAVAIDWPVPTHSSVASTPTPFVSA